MQYFKIYDNELCPCGSGKNYIECCKNRKDKPVKKSKKPLNIQIMEQFRKSQIKCCLYPDSKRCVKHIKEAHALQNNKIISQLSEDGHVYILNPNKQLQVIPIENEEPEIITLIDRVGVNHATTATCFCDVHDDEVFAPIEKGAPAFNKDSDEHKYLYAYKAFIFEYYKKLVEQKILKENITKTPSLLKTPQYVQFYRAISMTLEEMNKVKKFFDNGIVNKDYNGLETCVIEIPESIKFATYSCIAIDFDLFGKRIRHTKRGFISRLFITIFPEETKSYILLSCLREDVKVYKKFFQQLQTTNLEKVKYYFDLILPLYTENSADKKPLPEKPTEIELRNVSFGYNEKDGYILNNISMKINPYSKIAIVGYNGAGKTTLIKLIMRLYDPNEGEILLDGVNIKEYDVEEYRRKIGTVFQDFKIFAATVKENVLLDFAENGKDEDVVKAIEKSGFAERLETLSDGLQTNLTPEFEENGVSLSGGEGQKLAVARVFYKDANLIILDEPSSALDPIAEYHLNHSMLTAAENKSVVFISHRLSTTRIADRIYMLEKGIIIEEGSHAELLAKMGKYAQMWRVQAGQYL